MDLMKAVRFIAATPLLAVVGLQGGWSQTAHHWTFTPVGDLRLAGFPPLIPASCPQFPALNGPGVLCEDFDTERNGVPGFQFTRLPIGVSATDPLRAIGDPNDDVL